MRAPGPRLRLALTVLAAALGGALAALAGLPVPWLLGSAIAVTLVSLAGMAAPLPDRLRDLAFFVLGIQAGSGVTPAVAEQIAIWPLSFLIQMVGVVLTVLLTVLFLRRVLGWDKDTALFASLPGALSFVLAAATQTRADIAKVTIVQSVRLILLLGALTPTLAWLEGGAAPAGGPAARPDGDGDLAALLLDYALLFGLSLVFAGIGVRLRIPGGLMLGALLGSAVLHAGGIVEVGLPPLLATPGLVLLGALIGSRLVGIDRATMARLLPASIGAFAIGLLASGLAALVGFAVLAIDVGTVALAYAPGALEALTILAFQFDLDPAYVAAHHVVRFLCIAFAVPFLARRAIAGRRADDEP